MKNAISETAKTSRKNLAIFFITISLVVISGIFAFKISLWNNQQANLFLSFSRERQGKEIWKQIIQSNVPPWMILSDKNKLASITEDIDDLIAIGISGPNNWTIKYNNNNNFIFTEFYMP